MPEGPVLIVDDDNEHLCMLRTVVGDWGHAVETAASASGCVAMATGEKGKRYSLILLDVKMEREKAGLEILPLLKDGLNRSTPIVIMTAFSGVEDAVRALKTGACDYIKKPLDLGVLRHSIDNILKRPAVDVIQAPGAPAAGVPLLIGKSKAFREMMDMAMTVAPSEATVLITGESGTGKEMVAKVVQAYSGRSTKPFVTINCAALPDTMLESELFGHERGAFTDAHARKDGRIKAADGGTVFLDEIGDTSLSFQVKLLRTIQEREIQPLGANDVQKVDVRFIAATNRDLDRLVDEGRFREDLYYRLNVMPIAVPSLCERKEDLEDLALHFVRQFAEKNRKDVVGLDPGAMAAVLRHTWPGNIRELQNAMERAVILAKDRLITESNLALKIPRVAQPYTGAAVAAGAAAPSVAGAGAGAAAGAVALPGPSPDALPGAPAGPGAGADAQSLDDFERVAIRKAMEMYGGNKTQAAGVLGVTRKTLSSKIKRLGMEAEGWGKP
jgi:two-component system response regulator HydG